MMSPVLTQPQLADGFADHHGCRDGHVQRAQIGAHWNDQPRVRPFMHIIGLLARCYGGSPSPDHRATLRIGEALSHLERHIHEDVNLDELASIAHMSRRSFLRVFQSATGTSPLAWRLNQRVQRACHLLRNTDKRITEIAFDVGFNDSNYFTRQFRQITGQSPREYRMRR